MQRTNFAQFLLRNSPAAQEGANPCLQLRHLEGLDQIIIRPGIQSFDPILRFRTGGQQDHGPRIAAFAHL